MKKFVFLFVSLIAGVSFASEYCQTQKLYGFEEAVFMLGSDVQHGNPQDTFEQLLFSLSSDLKQIDAFVTPKTAYQLFRDTFTNELFLMTSSADHVCFYQVPTQEPIRFGHELS